jgi:hypothetical protein
LFRLFGWKEPKGFSLARFARARRDLRDQLSFWLPLRWTAAKKQLRPSAMLSPGKSLRRTISLLEVIFLRPLI